MRAGKIVAAACAVMFVGGLSAQEVGKPAPAFSAGGRGADVRLADMKGRVVLVDFWASWCAPCKQSFPWMNDMQAKYGPKGLTIVGINVDKKREDADKFLAGTPAKFSVAYDTTGCPVADCGSPLTPRAGSIEQGSLGAIEWSGGFRHCPIPDQRTQIRHPCAHKRSDFRVIHAEADAIEKNKQDSHTGGL